MKLGCHGPKLGYLQVSGDGEMSRWGDLCRRALLVRSRFGLLASPQPAAASALTLEFTCNDDAPTTLSHAGFHTGVETDTDKTVHV